MGFKVFSKYDAVPGDMGTYFLRDYEGRVGNLYSAQACWRKTGKFNFSFFRRRNAGEKTLQGQKSA